MLFCYRVEVMSKTLGVRLFSDDAMFMLGLWFSCILNGCVIMKFDSNGPFSSLMYITMDTTVLSRVQHPNESIKGPT